MWLRQEEEERALTFHPAEEEEIKTSNLNLAE